MKPSTQDLIDRAVLAATKAWAAQDKTILPLAIEAILREQDKLTRHACADAIAELNTILPSDQTTLVYQAAAVALSAAQSACMNTQSI